MKVIQKKNATKTSVVNLYHVFPICGLREQLWYSSFVNNSLNNSLNSSRVADYPLL
jgi:hypothetical protein